MSFFRDIWADLVEKRLWPLALLLVVAMVAAPVLLSGGSAEEAAPLAPAAAPVTPSGDPVASAAGAGGPDPVPVSLEQAPNQPAPQGAYKDPFAGAVKAAAQGTQPPPPSSEEAAKTAALAAATDARGVDGITGPTGSPDTTIVKPADPADPVAPVPTPDTSPAPVADGVFAGYRVDLHWGRAGATDKLRDVVRLKRLDAGDEPLLVYFGVRRDGKRALFLLTTGAGAVGDGRCMPSNRSCQVIEMARGESQFFDVETANGSLVQYELDVDRIVERSADTERQADELRERESKLGRELMYDAIETGRDYSTSFMYRSSLGVLVRDVKATTSWFRQATYAEVDAEPAQ